MFPMVDVEFLWFVGCLIAVVLSGAALIFLNASKGDPDAKA